MLLYSIIKALLSAGPIIFPVWGYIWYALDEEEFPTEEMPEFWRKLLRSWKEPPVR